MHSSCVKLYNDDATLSAYNGSRMQNFTSHPLLLLTYDKASRILHSGSERRQCGETTLLIMPGLH